MNTVDQHIAGAIQTDVKNVLPQRHAQTILEQAVDVNRAVVKDVNHKGKILYVRVVLGNILNDLIRQRALARRLLGKAVIFSADGRSVCEDLT
mgnify:CR=1 FL=1